MQSAEEQIRYSDKKEGVITCFLSMVLLLILSLVSVTLESARVAGIRFLTESYTGMARDSVMAGYSSVLFDRYHVFSYNAAASAPAEVREELKSQTEYYINRNLQSGSDMLWEPMLEEVRITACKMLADEDGKLFREAAAEYMKYRGASAMVEQLLSSLGVFQGAEETMKLMETKAETEEALAEIDECILELFEYVDGFLRDETGIRQNIWGKVKIKRHFVKKLFCKEAAAENTQINHATLLEAVQSYYLDPQEQFDSMRGYLDDFDAAQMHLEEIMERLAELDTDGFFTNPAVELERSVLEAEQLFFIGKLQFASQRYQSMLRNWKTVVKGCRSAAEDALEVIEEIRSKQESLIGKVLQYEEQLLEAARWLDVSLYENLWSGLTMMKRYVDLETEGAETIIDIDRMEESLRKNKDILTCIETAIGEDAEEEDKTSLDARDLLEEMEEEMSGYTHEGLCFDYSEIHLEAEGESPVESFGSLLLCGVAELVLKDSGEVSQTALTGGGLPSVLRNASASESSCSSGTMVLPGIGNSGISPVMQMINANNPFSGVVGWIGRESAEVLERVLFLSYLSGHFSNYETEERAESVLEYEQEYILCGNRRDSVNLYEVISRILLVRIIFNLIHVLGDAEKCSLAKETALGLLGVTGLPILVSVMKYLILFVWASEGALVETAAILHGKKLSVIPSKEDFPVHFSELLLMSKSKIQQKAETLSEPEGFGFGYSEYLMMFLLLQDEKTQSMRALDLIQENLALEEPGFLVSQLVHSFTAQAEYRLAELFTALPFSRRRTGGYVF